MQIAFRERGKSSMNKIKVATGNILIINGDKNKKLECLSIGDYGKDKNIKADFLGLKKDINGVPNGECLSLKEKWVITISTQYGCSMNCTFCDVPRVGEGINVTYNDLKNQVIESLKLHPEIKSTKRLNVHYARMGEPTFNTDVLKFSYDLRKIVRPYVGRSLVHPVLSTMLPKSNKKLLEYINEWVDIKNYYFRGDAGLQFSINTTDEKERIKMFSNNALTLEEISKFNLVKPKGRKYALNIVLLPNTEVNAEKLRDLFNPNHYMVKITPLHFTKSAKENKLINSQMEDSYKTFVPYKKHEEKLKKGGFDVLVFIPSLEEDLSDITCGNAVLSQGGKR